MTDLIPLEPAKNIFIEKFKILFSEFQGVPDETLLIFKEQAFNAVPAGRFGAQTERGRMLHMAHNMLLSKVQTSDGNTLTVNNIASQTVGSMSVSFDTSSNVADGGSFNQSQYGKEFYLLLKAYRPMPFCVNGRAVRV